MATANNTTDWMTNFYKEIFAHIFGGWKVQEHGTNF
jgi:hypothetical protein